MEIFRGSEQGVPPVDRNESMCRAISTIILNSCNSEEEQDAMLRGVAAVMGRGLITQAECKARIDSAKAQVEKAVRKECMAMVSNLSYEITQLADRLQEVGESCREVSSAIDILFDNTGLQRVTVGDLVHHEFDDRYMDVVEFWVTDNPALNGTVARMDDDGYWILGEDAIVVCRMPVTVYRVAREEE